jgi:O-acetyl-ADP-ribose deacetylase (regulator of RNase III)
MGDITEERTEVIVNAANGMLAHSGGVAAAIQRAGGS